MNRNIKFRIWDRFEQRFLTVNELHNYNISPVDGSVLSLDGHDCDARFYLSQYTGLKDANGIEIYEGDIVKSETVLGKWPVGVINFFRGCFIVAAVNNNFEPIHIINYINELGYSCYVMGNIYENPELVQD